MEEKKQDLIIVARPADGFRRAGHHHPAQQVRHPAGTFSEEQIALLKREPQLVVIEVDPEPEGGGSAKAGRGKGVSAG
ncbi:hypothetical protein J2847_005094 [Azospirillum agricola]|uniref:HI1506-related protein n=1 Tax=Azospirillum agricola TaxID=1720247 RepID=UPI001AE58FB1|nr:HI1506-related protein [Azospirillum agricola]MBP2231775.1 hypothetical protein [Azospirillum agricola]